MSVVFPAKATNRTVVLGRESIDFDQAADGAANTTTAERVIGIVHFPAKLDAAVRIVPTGAVTANATNNATITIGYRRAGGSRVTIATLVTDVAGGNWTAFTVKLATNVAGIQLAADDVITLQVAKGGTGVQLPTFRVSIPLRGENV